MWFAASAAMASVYGTLDNFDVVNDTGGTAHGFEIEIHDIHESNITSIFGDATRWPDMERYGVPTVTEYSDASGFGVRITYKATYSNGSWSASTPSGTLPVSPSDSCWPYGAADYGPNYPCDHFGVSTNVSTPNVVYSWLVEDATPGNLVPVVATVPNPVWTVTPQPPINNVPQPPLVNVAIAAPEPIQYEFGEPRWVKVTATGTLEDIAIEDLVAENAIIKKAQTQVQIEWQLIQSDIGDPQAGQIDLTGVELDEGAAGVVYRFEFYKYIGARDPETNEAKPVTSDTPAQPDPADLGEFIVAQNAGINFDGVIPEAPPLPIAPSINATIAGAIVGQAYSQVINATPGNPGDTLEITVTGLPAGLSFDSATNTIAGTPTLVGTFPLVITVKDLDNGLTTTATTNINVADAPIVFDLTFLPATVGSFFSQTFSVTGGYGAITYSIFETLPDGLSLAGDTLSGTPTLEGSYPLTVTARDSLGYSQNAVATLVVDPAPVDPPPPPPPVACAGTNEVITFVTARDPVHIDIAGGVANGGKSVNIPPQEATTIVPPLTAATAFQPGVLATYTGTMDDAGVFCNADTLTLAQGLTLPQIVLPNGQVGSGYGPIAVTPSGGVLPYSIGVANLPAGLAFDGAAISGIPTMAGTFTVGFSVSDSNSQTVFFNSQLVIDPAPLALSVAALPAGEVGLAYSSSAVSVSGGTAPYTFAGSNLPAGLSVNAATGALSGTPTAAFNGSITVQVTDQSGQTVSTSAALQIVAKVGISTTSLKAGTRNRAYSATLLATGGKSPYAWSLVGGALPAGLSLNASTGVISGKPTAAGTFNPVFNVTDSLGASAQKTLRLVIR